MELSERRNAELFDHWHAVGPEPRLELVAGEYLVGHVADGSRLMLRKIVETRELSALLAFGTMDAWWTALREPFEVPAAVRTHAAWLTWAGPKRVDRPLEAVSQHQNWTNHTAARALSHAIAMTEHDAQRNGTVAGDIACFHTGGFATRLGEDGWAPTAFVVAPDAWGTCYDGYNQGPATIHIEAAPTGLANSNDPVLAAFERRLAAYANARVPEVWLVGADPPSFRVLRLAANGYAPAPCDSEGVYRTPLVPGLEIRTAAAAGSPHMWYQHDCALVRIDPVSIRPHPRHVHERPEGLARWDARAPRSPARVSNRRRGHQPATHLLERRDDRRRRTGRARDERRRGARGGSGRRALLPLGRGDS
jgi:hypothetical protein